MIAHAGILISMSTLSYVVIFSAIGGLFSLIGGILLLRSKRSASTLVRYATPFAGGALLAAVFLDLLHEGIEQSGTDTVLLAALSGMILFFLAEGFLHWFHHHHHHDDNSRDPSAVLVIIGDTLHNALDGVAIAASFLISVPTGIVTTVAVAAHEIPQEIGDFGLLLSKGLSRKSVLLVNVMSALATVVFAVVTYLLGSNDRLPVGVLLGLSAGFLLYIAASDIIPAIHENRTNKRIFDIQAILLLAGVVTVALTTTIAHQYIAPAHEHYHESITPQHHHDDVESHE